MKRKILPIILCILSALIALCSGCSKNITPISQTDFYFDTVITITLYDTNRLGTKRCNEILASCFSLCESYEAMFSRTKEGSDIWNINHADGAPITVHPETAALLQKSLFYCEQTNGLVDITIAPVTDLWDFSSEHLLQLQNTDTSDTETPLSSLPTKEQLTNRLAHVDYKKVNITGNTVILKDADAALDLGCIAKGYIADCLKMHLQAQGISCAIINLGGNLQTLGTKPDGSPFLLGIQKPFGDNRTPIATLPVTDSSLVSSGVYERYFEAGGIRYHHLLNPRTGLPENNGLLGVTILTASSADADILSTAAFLLGLEKGIAYIDSLPDTEAVFITEDGSLHPTDGLSGLLQMP